MISFLRNHVDHLIKSDDHTVLLDIDTTIGDRSFGKIQCQFTCLTEQLWNLQFKILLNDTSAISEQNNLNLESEDLSQSCVNQQLLESAVRDATSNRNRLTLKRTEVNSRGVREVIFTPQSVRSEREQMLHGNLSSSRGAAPCVELVIYHFEDSNEKWCSFYFRNERGFPFQRNWEFGIKEQHQKDKSDLISSLAFKIDLSDEVVGAYGLGISDNANYSGFNKLSQRVVFNGISGDNISVFNCPFVLLASNQPHSERDDFDLEHSSKCFHGLLVDAVQENQIWDLNGLNKRNLTVEVLSESGKLRSSTLSCYIFASNNPEKVLQIYTNELTGKSPLPPLWALGTHFLLGNDENIQQQLNDLKNVKIPVDCIHIDSLTSENSDLSTVSRNVHIVCKIEPGSIQPNLASDQSKRSIDRLTWERELANLQKRCSVSGYHLTKSTMNMNKYGREVTQITNMSLVHSREHERPFVISESGIPGVQQYSWNVIDSESKVDWSDLKGYLQNVLTLGLSGQSGCGISLSELSEKDLSDELLVRFLQLTCLLPFFQIPLKAYLQMKQSHSQIISAFIHLRYQLMPFIYTQIQQAFSRGVPFCKPMFLQYPTCERCYDSQWDTSQFLIGDCLLIAPIMDQNATSRQVYLPPDDTWYELNMDETCLKEDVSNGLHLFDWHMLVDNCTLHHGDQIITIARRSSSPSEWLSRLPVFVRAGSVIPIRSVQSPVKNVNDLMKCDLNYVMFPDKRRSRKEGGETVEDMAPSEGVLYLDDGHSMKHRMEDETGGKKEQDFGLFRLYCSEVFCGIDQTLVQIERIAGSNKWKPELSSLFSL